MSDLKSADKIKGLLMAESDSDDDIEFWLDNDFDKWLKVTNFLIKIYLFLFESDFFLN